MIEKAELLVRKIRESVGIVKYSPTEIVTAFLAILCFSAATLGLENEFVKALFGHYLDIVRCGLLAISGVLFVFTVVRIWKQAIPPALPPAETRPSAVKGPMPFTREDGELFRSLGRKAELESLLAHVLDEQIPLVVVMGESGVGKTSLLRAGLSHALAQRNIRLLYWEALPTNAMEALLHAIQVGWDTAKNGTLPKDINEAVNALSVTPGRTVIVLDQFEQLRPDNEAHHELFEMLKRFVTSGMAPYRLTWILAFRREYDPQWRDFELSIPGFHPPMLSLRLFEKNRALVIMAILAAASDFTLSHELTTDMIDAAANQDNRVSPVDIAIGMLVLSGLAFQKSRKHLNKDDYRFAGGAEGILTAYVSDRLERLGEGDRQGVMKALLALSNLDNNQRIPEGKTVDQLSAAAQLPPTRLSAYLEYLASPHVRLLEQAPTAAGEPPKYRLPHDRIVPSLRRLTGLFLAEADEARLVFENAFRSWLNRRSDRFLLTGAELKKVLKHGDRLFGGAVLPEKFAFLQRSRRKRNERRLYASGILLGVVTIGTLLWLEVNVFEPKKQVAQNIHQLETADLKGRLDAIARLTKLAQDHEDVAPDVLNRLAAYVREHAPWKEGITSTSIAQDVQDALSDIGRIRKSDSRGEPFDPVDLHNVDISWATLEYANLERVVLWGSNLVHVDLAWANLNHADVGGVDFTDASLEHAHLDGALCPPSVYASPKRGCIFQRTHFYDASLKGTRLEGADLRRAIDLSQEQLKEAIINHDTRLPDYLSPNKPGGSQ